MQVSKNSNRYFEAWPSGDSSGAAFSQVLVVSDLHISEGCSRETRLWDRRENFTADQVFCSFLRHKQDNAHQAC